MFKTCSMETGLQKKYFILFCIFDKNIVANVVFMHLLSKWKKLTSQL